MKTIRPLFMFLFSLSLLGSCMNIQSQSEDIYTKVTASQQAMADVAYTTQSLTPVLTKENTVKINSEDTHLTAVAFAAPPQSTPSPFPTLEFTPLGRIAYIDSRLYCKKPAYHEGSSEDFVTLYNFMTPLPSFCSEFIHDAILHVMDGNGKNEVTTVLPFGGTNFTWSPDGQTIVYSCSDNNSLCFLDTTNLGRDNPDIHKIDLPLSVRNMRYIDSLTWSPDSKAIAFIRTSQYEKQLCVLTYKTMETDCSSSNLILKGFSEEDFQIFSQATSVVWSPVDADLMIISSPWSGKLYLINLSQKTIKEIETPEPLVYMGRSVAWSPDGRRIAFSFLGMYDSPINPKRICQNYACLDFPVPILATINIDGTNYEKILDGTHIFYRLPLEDLRQDFPPISTHETYYHIESPSWSPDGRFLLFVTEIAPMNFPHTRVFRVDLQSGYFVMLKNDKFFGSVPISWSP